MKLSSEAVQLAAVQQNGNVIQDIKNSSEILQLAAVKQDPNSIFLFEPNSTTIKLFESQLRQLADT